LNVKLAESVTTPPSRPATAKILSWPPPCQPFTPLRHNSKVSRIDKQALPIKNGE